MFINELKNNKLFDNIDKSDLNLLLTGRKPEKHPKGSVIYKENELGQSVYLILSGEIAIAKERFLGRSKKEAKFANDFFGEESYLEKSPRPYTAYAQTEVQIIEIEKSKLDLLVSINPNLISNLKRSASSENELVSENQNSIKKESSFEKNILNKESFIPKPQKEIKNNTLSAVKDELKVEPVKSEFTKPELDEIKPDDIPVQNADLNVNEKSPELRLKEELEQQLNQNSNINFDEISEDEFSKENFASPKEDLLQIKPDENIADLNQDSLQQGTREIIQAENSNAAEEIKEGKVQDNKKADKKNKIKQQTEHPKVEVKFESEITSEIISANENIQDQKDKESALSQKNEIENKNDAKLSTFKLKEIINLLNRFSQKQNIDELIKELLIGIKHFTSCENTFWYFIDADKKLVYNGKDRVKFGEGSLGWTAKNNQILNVKNYKAELKENKSEEKIKNILCMPVNDDEKNRLGIIQLINSSKGEFDKNDVEIVQLILQNFASVYNKLSDIDAEIKKEKIKVLQKMSKFLDQDIKKPVFISKRYADHIKNKELNEETASLVKMLLEQINLVADVIHTTVNYAADKTVLRTLISPLNETLDEYIEKLNPQIFIKKCKIEKKFDENANVKIDNKELYQVFWNLVKNSCEAMPEGGKIVISTETNFQDVVKISIKDEGIGIAENMKDKIFEPFVSINNKENAGLGLSISKEIIEDHGGKISVNSELNKGTEFIITLPKESI